MPEDPVIRVRVKAFTLARLRAIEEAQPDLGCRPAARRTDTGFVTDVYLPEPRFFENGTAYGRERACSA